jgi:hypothetical protein
MKRVTAAVQDADNQHFVLVENVKDRKGKSA